MIRKSQILKIKGDKRADVLFVYEPISEERPEDLILVALRYGADKFWVLKPRIVAYDENTIVIRDGGRRYVIKLY